MAKASASAGTGKACWRLIWALDVPPRIKIFAWKVGVQALATKTNLATRIPTVDMRCDICGAVEESNVHILFLCPLAREIWSGSGFDEELWDGDGPNAWDVVARVANVLSADRVAEFVAVMWECWNSRNRFIFGQQDCWRGGLAQRAINFVHEFRAMKEQGQRCSMLEDQSIWEPPSEGLLKVNFDAGMFPGAGGGWGFTICDKDGDIVLAGVSQKMGYNGAELEEAGACLFALKQALAHGFRNLVIEGDCLALISKLRRQVRPNNMLGFFISAILSTSALFEFVSWSFVRRGGNCVAHSLAKYQPFVVGERLWREEVPEERSHLASRDMCTFSEHRLI